MEKIIFSNHEPGMNANSEELAKVIINRIGLSPRKEGSTDKMYRTFLELYERSKRANREKNPELSVMTVDEMGYFAGITRQTMYDYLKRWMALNLIVKTSYIKDGKVIIGYKLNGNTLEQAFEKTVQKVNNHQETTMKYIKELQKIVKNEKLSKNMMKSESSEVLEDDFE
ncbi:MAG: hypothetical protein ACLFPQ_05745 [Candidatus Woesearchaeota archaeon]